MKIPVQTLVTGAISRFDGIVSARVREDERRAHAALMSGLAAVGLVAALGMPALGFAAAPTEILSLAAAVSSVSLVLAAVLSLTGAFEAILGAAIAGGALMLALGAVLSGGVGSPLFWLMPIVPLEGLLSRRAHRFRTCFGIASLAMCLVLAAETLALASGSAAPLAAPAAGATLLGYGILLGLRARRAIRERRRRRAADAAEARLRAAIAGKAALRFAPDGALIEVSDEARRRFGHAVRDDRLPFLLSAVHVADRVRYLAAFGEVRAGAGEAACAARFSDGAGGFAELAFTLAGSGGASGAPASILLVADDEAREAPASGEDLRSALGRAQAVSQAKSNFLAMVSHELRTPLNAIIGFSDVLDQELFGGFPDPRQKEYVGLIRQSGEHLLAVVNGLLDISKIEAGRYEILPEPLQLDGVLAAAVQTVRGEAERKGLTLSVENRCGATRLVADRRAVHQILLNLLSNAVKFTDKGGVSLGAEVAGDFVKITVRDTGAGIAEGELARLGEPFVQGSAGLARQHPGTGLGLSLVKGFAELHGGSMAIRSRIGRGTTVEVTIGLGEAGQTGNESNGRVVALKHGRNQEAHLAAVDARRSA